MITKTVLAQPETGYGAVWGRNQQKQNKRYIIFGVVTALYVATIIALIFPATILGWLPLEPAETVMGFLTFFAWAYPIVGLLGGFPEIFSYNDEIYANDVWQGRQLYAKTVFKEWFTQQYGIKVTEEEAVELMNGRSIHTTRDDNFGRQEVVRVRFEYNGSFSRFTDVGSRPNSEYVQKDNWDMVDVNEVDFQLLVVEEPAKPRTYQWS